MIPYSTVISPEKNSISNLIIIFCIGIVFYHELGLSNDLLKNFFNEYGFKPILNLSEFSPDLFFRSITYNFINESKFQFFLNIWALWVFGDLVEDRTGRILFILLFLTSGIAGALTLGMLNPEISTPAVGSSCATIGVLTAFGILYPKYKVKTLVPVILLASPFQLWPAYIFLSAFVIYQLSFLYTKFDSPAAMMCILGSIVVGAAWGFIFRKSTGKSIN